MEYQKILTHYACDYWLKRFYDSTFQNTESNEQENIFLKKKYGHMAKQKRKCQEICIVVRDRIIKVIIFK